MNLKLTHSDSDKVLGDTAVSADTAGNDSSGKNILDVLHLLL